MFLQTDGLDAGPQDNEKGSYNAGNVFPAKLVAVSGPNTHVFSVFFLNRTSVTSSSASNIYVNNL